MLKCHCICNEIYRTYITLQPSILLIRTYKIKIMKKITLLLLAAFFIITATMAQAPNVPAEKGANFGAVVKADDAVSPDVLAALLKDKQSAEVKVKGMVVDVCKAKGCFIYLKTSTGKIYVKTKDDAFFVPLAINGKTVVVQGTASKDKDNKDISIQATGILVM
jgi:Domain of unknown function (DUF4920)